MRAGRTAYHNGLAAEEIAAGIYLREGGRVLSERWRCAEGEIDLVIGLPGIVVFVEVKARRTRDVAAGAVTQAQWRRLGAAAERWLAENPAGAPECRFDVVLIDGAGMAERVENAHSFDV